MKNQLQKIGLLLVAILGLTASGQVLANHIPVADLSYVQLSSFTYQVSLRVYRGCNSSGVPSVMLNVNAPGCNTGRTIPFTLASSSQINEQNCSTPAPPVCRFIKYLYTATVTFTAAEQACPDWVFSYTECCRSSVANLVNASAANMYTEATVKIGQNLFNSSPGFSPLEDPVPVISGLVVYRLAGNDPDCDSLSFELVHPLAAPNSPIMFERHMIIGTTGSLIANPCPKPPYSNPFNSQFAFSPSNIPQTYSVTHPLPAIAPISWNLPPTYPFPSAAGGFLWEFRRGVDLNRESGQLSFWPEIVVNSPNPADNQYTVEVKINEWRKVSGMLTLVGSTRRTIFLTLNFNNPLISGTLENVTVNGHSIASGDIITLRPGMPLNLQLPTGTCNYQGNLTLSSDVDQVLPGAQFSPGSGNNPTGSITWRASHICTGVKFFQVKVEDDVCPIRGFQTHTFGVRVSNTAAVTGLPEKLTDAATFAAFPNPFNNQLNFRLQMKQAAKSQVLIYNSLGQMVDRLEVKPVGDDQEITWEKANEQANGFYMAQLVCNGQPVKAIRFTKVN